MNIKLLITTLTVTAAQAFAQTSSPYWNGNGPTYPDPTPDIRAVPFARADQVRQKWTYQQTQTNLNNAIRLASQQLENEPEYRTAIAEEKTAYDEMAKAREAALNDLANKNAQYSAALTLSRNVTQQIEDEKFAKKPDQVKIDAMARLRLQYIKGNRTLEASALQNDKTYQDAQARLLQAAKKTQSMREKQALQIATNADLVTLRNAVAQARIERLVSSAFLDATIDARERSIGYSRFYRGIDRYHGTGGYGYGGYYNGPYRR